MSRCSAGAFVQVSSRLLRGRTESKGVGLLLLVLCRLRVLHTHFWCRARGLVAHLSHVVYHCRAQRIAVVSTVSRLVWGCIVGALAEMRWVSSRDDVTADKREGSCSRWAMPGPCGVGALGPPPGPRAQLRRADGSEGPLRRPEAARALSPSRSHLARCGQPTHYWWTWHVPPQ